MKKEDVNTLFCRIICDLNEKIVKGQEAGERGWVAKKGGNGQCNLTSLPNFIINFSGLLSREKIKKPSGSLPQRFMCS